MHGLQPPKEEASLCVHFDSHACKTLQPNNPTHAKPYNLTNTGLVSIKKTHAYHFIYPPCKTLVVFHRPSQCLYVRRAYRCQCGIGRRVVGVRSARLTIHPPRKTLVIFHRPSQCPGRAPLLGSAHTKKMRRRKKRCRRWCRTWNGECVWACNALQVCVCVCVCVCLCVCLLFLLHALNMLCSPTKQERQGGAVGCAWTVRL